MAKVSSAEAMILVALGTIISLLPALALAAKAEGRQVLIRNGSGQA
jgi:hypothetical protein